MIRSYTAAEVAHIWRRPIGTIYRLASEHGWRRNTDRRRPTLYNADDVEATMNGTEETPRPSVLVLIPSKATVIEGEPVGWRRINLPPDATLRFGDHQVHIPAGQEKAILWDGDWEVVTDTPEHPA